MRSKKSFSILFWTYSKRTSQNHSPVYARITINGKRVNFSLKVRVNNELWDPKKQRARGNSHSARTLNHYLDQAYAKIFDCYC
jgi:hypothetical protein